MKIVTLRSMVILAALFVTLSTGALAQRSPILFADVPFDFYLQGTKIPAGEYSIERVNRDSNQAIIVVKRKLDGRGVSLITAFASDALPGKDAVSSSLTFNRIASAYYLVGINNGAGNYSLRLPRRKSTINDIGLLSPRPETVTIGLHR